MTPLEIFFAILPSLIVSAAMALFNRKTNKRDKYADELSAAKIESDRLPIKSYNCDCKAQLRSGNGGKTGRAQRRD